MSDYQNRVRAELSELTQRREKLADFLTDQPLINRLGVSPAEVSRLRRQHAIMWLYEEVLKERVAAFDN